jgi:hypothetical protein
VAGRLDAQKRAKYCVAMPIQNFKGSRGCQVGQGRRYGLDVAGACQLACSCRYSNAASFEVAYVISKSDTMRSMKAKHAKTLKMVFAKPTSAGIVFADIEALIVALGGHVREGEGSRVVFEIDNRRFYAHRPHPGKEAKRYQIEEMRSWFESLGVKP